MLYCPVLLRAMASCRRGGRNRPSSAENLAHAALLFWHLAPVFVCMAHARKTEDCLEALSRLRRDPSTPAARAEVGQYLSHKSNAVVAKAAQLVGEFELQDLHPQLVEAF